MATLAAPAQAGTVNVPANLDCALNFYGGQTNECGEDAIQVGVRYTVDDHFYMDALRFDDVASEVPAGAVVESATLHIYGGRLDDRIDAFSVNDTWDDTVTGDTFPTDISLEDSSRRLDDPWVTFDVTRPVHEWVAGNEDNDGFAVGIHPNESQPLPASSDDYVAAIEGGSTTAPYLEIKYYEPCPSDPFAAAQTQSASTVYYWNNVLLSAFRGPSSGATVQRAPTRLARAAAMMNVAVFDTFNSVFFAQLEDLASGNPDNVEACGWSKYQVLADTPANTDANLAAAIAARNVLLSEFPDYTTQINAAFTYSAPLQTAANKLGTYVATQVINARSSDGSGTSMSYTPASSTPGAWRPSPTSSTQAPCTAAVTPQWGNVTPFTLSSASQFRQPLPGGYTSYASLLASSYYADQVNEVRDIGAVSSGTRTSDQTNAAWFWANDLDGYYKPPGQLIEHTRLVAISQPSAETSGAPEDFSWRWSQQGIRVARLFAEVSLAMADSGIAAWDVKYNTAIDLWRPIDAIREGSTDGNPDTGDDDNWQPLSRDTAGNQFSPCFPAWESGHATFGGTWSRVMEHEFARSLNTSPFPLTLTSEDPHAVLNSATSRAFSSFADAANENAMSRLWLGVHYRVDALDGLESGRAVADWATSHKLQFAQTCQNWSCGVTIP